MEKKGCAVFCPHCMSFVDSRVEVQSETHSVKGVSLDVAAPTRVCCNCGEVLFDRNLDNDRILLAYRRYREQMKLLQPEEIKAIREQYHLSQTAFARILGLGDKTITRYESGSLQDEAQNNLILLMKDPQNFNILLWQNKDKISDKDFLSASKSFRPASIEPQSYEVQGGEEWSGWYMNIPSTHAIGW